MQELFTAKLATFIHQYQDKNHSIAHIEWQDDSHLHAGHGSSGKGGHWTLFLVSDIFEKLSRVKRHQIIYTALAEEFKTNKIHALSLELKTPEEVFDVKK